MIIDVKQKRSSMGTDFVFYVPENLELYHAEARLDREGSDIALIQNNERILMLSSDEVPIDLTGILFRDKVLYNIKKLNGDICGEITLKVVKKFLARYKYIQINFNAELLNCYEVNMGKEGNFVCIYIGDLQIALIDKTNVSNDNLDSYKIYLKDEKYIQIVCLYVVYYDHATSANYNEFTYKSKKTSYENSPNKELKSKYNPQFKEQC